MGSGRGPQDPMYRVDCRKRKSGDGKVCIEPNGKELELNGTEWTALGGPLWRFYLANVCALMLMAIFKKT